MKTPYNDPIWQEIAAATHAFQSIRPLHPQANAQCARCGLLLPHGPILCIGPSGLPPCADPPPVQDNRA